MKRQKGKIEKSRNEKTKKKRKTCLALRKDSNKERGKTKNENKKQETTSQEVGRVKTRSQKGTDEAKIGGKVKDKDKKDFGLECRGLKQRRTKSKGEILI